MSDGANALLGGSLSPQIGETGRAFVISFVRLSTKPELKNLVLRVLVVGCPYPCVCFYGVQPGRRD